MGVDWVPLLIGRTLVGKEILVEEKFSRERSESFSKLNLVRRGSFLYKIRKDDQTTTQFSKFPKKFLWQRLQPQNQNGGENRG
jgi:hypothetical protein